jgi:exopolysaccharide/PEP-CTERM locus tyrosine autokinase
VGKIFDALEKFSKEGGAPKSDKIRNADYEVLRQFDESTGKIDIDDPEYLKDAEGIKRLMTYRLINDDGTLTLAGRAKYEEMARKSKTNTDASADAASINEKPVFKHKEQKVKVSSGFINTRQSDWALLMNYDRKTGNLLKYDPETGQLAEDSKIILQDPATVQRLIDNHMILPGGWLTPEAKKECARIEKDNDKKQPTESVKHVKRKKVRAADKLDKISKPQEPLSKVDMEVLLQHDTEARKLDMSQPAILKEPAIVKRLLEHNMIEPNGKLTPQALVRCRVLTHWQQELEEKKAAPQQPKESISEKLQTIADKGMPQNRSDEVGEKKLKIIPLDKGKAETRIEAKKGEKEVLREKPSGEDSEKKQKITPVGKDRVETKIEAKKEEEKVLGKTNNFMTALEARTGSIESTEVPSERKFTLGKAPGKYARREIEKDLVTLMNPQSFEAEQFKILRTNLLFAESGKTPRSVMVTSSVPNEGKSFVASNLAVSVAQHVNWNVLLIDCDLRRPSIHKQFGFQNETGLSDYLANGVDLPPLLLRTGIENLTILPAGKPIDNPSELLSSERMAALLEEAATRYNDRLIILDSPPPKMTAESGALARYVDGILLVVKYGSTPKDSATELINKLGRDKIIGAVINYFEAGASRYHKKYYGGYYYGNRS